MKKKLLSILFTAVLAASTLAGCGQTTTIAQDPTGGETPKASADAPTDMSRIHISEPTRPLYS